MFETRAVPIAFLSSSLALSLRLAVPVCAEQDGRVLSSHIPFLDKKRGAWSQTSSQSSRQPGLQTAGVKGELGGAGGKADSPAPVPVWGLGRGMAVRHSDTWKRETGGWTRMFQTRHFLSCTSTTVGM